MSKSLLGKFESNIKYIRKYYDKLINRILHDQTIDSVSKWIVDHYYIVNEQEKIIIDEYRSEKIKRIKEKRKLELYDLVRDNLRETVFNLDTSLLFEKINIYQKEANDYLSYAEIDYINILLIQIFIDELRDISTRASYRLKVKDDIEKTFNRIHNDILTDPDFNFSDHLKLNDNIINDYYYIEQLNYEIKEMGETAKSVFDKLNVILQRNEVLLKDVIKTSQTNMAQDNILITNIFNSCEKVIRYKIEYIYRKISYTEKKLINEKVDVYDQMYDSTKGSYRHEIIKTAKKKKISEYKYVSELMVKADLEDKHIGWYLFKKKNYKLRTKIYITSIVALTVLFSAIISYYLGFVLFFLLLIPISGLVMDIFTQFFNAFTKPRSIFKLKFEDGLSSENATMVIIPTLMTTAEKVDRIFQKLEMYYLSNKTDNIYFTLLGDATGEKTRDVLKDEKIIEAGLNNVNELNRRYNKKIFNFVYRERTYSKSEECYMGNERKRGAITDFNKLLLKKLTSKEKNERFKCQTFNKFNVAIKYVITIDEDTKLILNSALKLIGAMAHPMNKPVLSRDGKRVLSGYGIMQPRIGIDVEGANKSKYSQLFAGLGGLDVYVTASFDLYQDIFGEGSFVGKGIYDLEIYETVLNNVFPNNLILSHDLIEGNYLRCGFINDVELIDGYPSSYLNDAARHHRWNRGDWQIISWLKKKVRNIKGELVGNPIITLSKWKIFDNLRRSLVSVCLLLVFFYGFTTNANNILYYLILVMTIITMPILFYIISKIIYRNRYDFFLKYYLNIIIGLSSVISRAFILLAVLPYEAYLYMDSIVKALYRMFISKKKLLNWITAEETERLLKNNLNTFIKSFVVNYIAAILLVLICFVFKPNDFMMASVIAIIWFIAPFLLYFLSRNVLFKEDSLTEEEKLDLRRLASSTWKYFSDFLKEEYNYLISDNYQFNREKQLDGKTSPTNIGFSLVSVVSAAELKFISTKEALRLISNIITSVEKLKKWNGHLYNWYDIHTLRELYPLFISFVDSGNFVASLYVVKGFLDRHQDHNIISRVEKLISNTNFEKIYNHDLDVFSVGYNLGEQSPLVYNYNNFASEARLSSYIAIAKGDVPYKHWFCLDRTLTKYKFYKGVISWSGSAFEYFMPLIFMKTYPNTLLDETYYFAYFAQREFAHEVNPSLPWGISEAGYDQLEDAENYQYKTFGIPYLKLKDSSAYCPVVISPYSSIMAISIDDHEVYNNILKFKHLNMYGKYGLYESYDNENKTITKNFYAHHQGMILASLTNYLKNNIIQDYFQDDMNIKANETLLKEKVQVRAYIDMKLQRYKQHIHKADTSENDARDYDGLSKIPEMSVLSNGFYATVINDKGVGFSKYKNLQINRYRKITTDNYGMFLYIRNMNSGKLWNNTYAPLETKGNRYKAVFASDRVKFIREDNGITTTTEITVVKNHNAEIRKVTFQNNTNKDVILEVTSYGEVMMTNNDEDIAARAFNGLMINSEIDEDTSSLIFSKRSNTRDNTKYFVIHRLFGDKDNQYPFEYETARANFIGRNGSTSKPKVIMENNNLSNFVGAALDPIMSIRTYVKVKARSKENLNILVGFGKSREQVLEIVEAYNNQTSIENAFKMATVLNNMTISYANLRGNEVRIFNVLLKYLYQATPISNKRIKILENNKLAQPSLWRYGISGNYPMILVEISNAEYIEFIKAVLQAYTYYKNKALAVDVIIVNNEDPEKEHMILNGINNLMYSISNLGYDESIPGNIHILSTIDMNDDERNLLYAASDVVFDASNGISFDQQVYELGNDLPSITHLTDKSSNNLPIISSDDMTFYNNYGGFIKNGQEYEIVRTDTPTPWANMIANEKIGAVITNNLGGYTYAHNSREYKLTSWSNDMTRDPASEIIIINNQKFKPSIIKHGFGYTTFSNKTKEYDTDIKTFVSTKDAVKFYEINIKNNTNENINFKCDFLLNAVLGVSEESTSRYLVSDFDKSKNRLYIRNTYDQTYQNIRMFITSTELVNLSLKKEVNMNGISVYIHINGNESKTFSFMIGTETTDDLIAKNYTTTNIDSEYQAVVASWQDKLSTIKVNTPDVSFNYMINGWYLYQVYVSRLYAKTSFYQSGGAIGFRDQLQDSMGVIYSDSAYTREQILKHAKHQFKDGDVLHWWFDDKMIGSRTKFSDDYLWLIYVTFEYLKVTDDYKILDEIVPFVDGEKLNEYESEKGIKYQFLTESDTLYNHLKLCINKALNLMGHHGLPLMGSGDWNDGMNKTGHKGSGESVFVGFFLYDNLMKMVNISSIHKDLDFAELCTERSTKLKANIDKSAWDGQWYLRAYYDNGDVLGSKSNLECQIDLLCQSWSILTDIADEEKTNTVIKSVEDKLVDKSNGLIKLLTPGFENSPNNPGYIRNYNVGLRENGGQYTHAALWYILALLKSNNTEDAYKYYQMINPINKSLQMEDVLKYKVEPYVIAADIYSNPTQLGRGGWTWYTGSASWAYKIGIEEILGFKKYGDILTINPKIPSSWDGYELEYKYNETPYKINVYNKKHLSTYKMLIKLDGKTIEEGIIRLKDDKENHKIEVYMEEK